MPGMGWYEYSLSVFSIIIIIGIGLFYFILGMGIGLVYLNLGIISGLCLLGFLGLNFSFRTTNCGRGGGRTGAWG